MIRLGNNEVLKTLTKTLTFVDADANADADAGGSTIALPERCLGELKKGKSLLQKFRPNCSKLTMSLVNDSLKFTSSDTQIC